MEDYYYFPTSWETTTYVKSGSRKGTSPSSRPHRAPRDDFDANADADAGELRHHYLDACFRCERLLGGNRDIFMYRGDTPFCSEECRQQQIEADEAREKRSKRQPAAARKEREQQQRRQRQSSSPPGIPLWAR